MSRNFDPIRRFWFLTRANPIQRLLWCGYLILLLLAPMHIAFLLLAVLWAAVWLLLDKLAAAVRLPGLAKPLTPNFYALRSPWGWQGVFQRKPPGGGTPCRELLLGLCREQNALPDALTPGRYRTVTHETVLRRLRCMENASIRSIQYAYTANMAGIYDTMTGGRCRHCTAPCLFYKAAEKERQFYFVVFDIS